MSDDDFSIDDVRLLAEGGNPRLPEVVPFDKGTDAVYFVRARGVALVKIGWSNDASARIYELQTGCPFDLVLVAQIPGDIPLERWLHRKFATSRARGEWFYLTEPVVKFIRAQAATMKTVAQAKKEREEEIAKMDRVDRMLLKYKPRPPRELKRTEPKPPPPRWASLREQIMEEFESSAIRRKLSDVRP